MEQNSHSSNIFFSSLERIGKLIEFKIEKGQHEKAEEYFEYLIKTYDKFFKLSYEKHGYIESLSRVEQNFKNFSLENSQVTFIEIDEMAKPEKNESQLNHQNISNAISVLCNIFYKIWKASYNNDDILFSRKTLNAINEEISKSSITFIQSSYIQELLNINYIILRQGTKSVDEDQKIFLGKPAYEWYLSSVFQDEFNIENYLSIFDEKLFLTFSFILKQDHQSLFNSFIKSIIHGTYDPSYNSFYFGYKEFEKLNIKIPNDKIDQLEDEAYELSSNSFHDIYTLKNLKDWQNKKETYRLKLELLIKSEEKVLINELLRKMNQQAEKTYKYRNLRFHVIRIGIFALFQKKFTYLRFMLNFNQPDDSPDVWNNKDITPTTLFEVTKFLSYKNHIENRIRFLWEDHHGFDSYFYEYFLILYLNAVKLAQRKGENLLVEVESITIDAINTDGNIKIHLKNLLDSLELIDDNNEILSILKFAPKHISEIRKLLENLYERANKLNDLKGTEEKLNSEIVKSFKGDVVKAFYKFAIIRGIYNASPDTYIDLDKHKIESPDLKLIGINEIFNNGFFINNSTETYFDLANSLGRNMAQIEDIHFLLKKILPKCEKDKINENSIIKIIENVTNLSSKILICINYSLSHNVFRNSKDYIKTWEMQPSENKIGLDGKYKNELEVFHIQIPSESKQIVMVDRDRMGKLVQYPPITEEKKESFNDIFFFEIVAFNDDSELIQRYINSKLPWLVEKGSSEAQRNYLKKSIWLRILEKSDIQIDNDNIGMCYEIEE